MGGGDAARRKDAQVLGESLRRVPCGRCHLPPGLLSSSPTPVPLLTAPSHSQTAANSWGPAWGERGHFRIVRGANECDIESFVLGVWGRVGMEDMGHH